MLLPTRSELSDEQEEFLFEAPLDKPVLCVGPPGTGKTILALYRASFLEKSGQEAELIMHSKLLNKYVERSLSDLEFNAGSRTWHSWVYRQWWKGERQKIPELAPFTPDFHKAVELVRKGQVANAKGLYWSHLIIDEGQDFPKAFYLFLLVMMMEPLVVQGRKTPSLTVFADENQRMDEEANSTIKEIKQYLPIDDSRFFKLSENYRNTERIARLAQHFFVGMSTGVPNIPKNRPGKVPLMRSFSGIDDEMNSVVRWLHNNEDLTAGVIVANRQIQHLVVETLRPMAASRGLKIQRYRSGDNVENIEFYSGGSITVVCDKSCKGLEFDGVFIPQLQNYQVDGVNEDFFRMKMYVMISRARQFLQLSFADCDESPPVLSMFPADDEEILRWEI